MIKFIVTRLTNTPSFSTGGEALSCFRAEARSQEAKHSRALVHSRPLGISSFRISLRTFIKRRLKPAATFCLVFTGLCQAQPVYIELSARGERMDLGVTPFVSVRSTPEENNLAKEIRDVVMADLRFCRYFNLVEDGPVPVQDKLNIPAWSELGSDIVLTAKIELSQDNYTTRLTGWLYDTVSGKKIWSQLFIKTGDQSLHQLAHQLSNQVIKQLTGTPGIFHTKISFANNATGSKEIYTIDYNGKGLKRLTNHRSVALLPKFSPDGQWITFTSYLGGRPEQYIMRADGSGLKKISGRPGLNSSAAWDPKGGSLLLTLSMEGHPHIYRMNLEGTILARITYGASANTAPSFSPNGNNIAFTSDRSGSPQIYVMDDDGTSVDRITHTGYADSAAWSPKGNAVAYVMNETGPYGGNFDIYLTDVASRVTRRLTFGEGDNENPSWSPDGNFIVFTSTRNRKRELFMMAADGTNPQPISSVPGDSFTPSWSQ